MDRKSSESGSSMERADFVSKDLQKEYDNIEASVQSIEQELSMWEANNPDKRSLVIVAGPTGSGKGTFSAQMSSSPVETTTLSMDRYYLGAAVQEKRDGKVNFSIPSALDTDRLREDIKRFLEARDGDTIQVPIYSMKESARTGEEDIRVTRRLIVEGIYAIDQVDVETPFTIYIDVSEDTMLERKLQRDVQERGIPEETVRDRFQKNVIPATREHVIPQRDQASIVIHNESVK